MGSFLLFAIPMTALAARDPESRRGYRIQSGRVKAQDLLHPSLGSFVVNDALLALFVAVAWPIVRLSGIQDGPPPAWYVVVAQVLAFGYLDDLPYYGVHRAMHRGWLWKNVHAVHRGIYTPWAITGHYVHPIEYVTTASLMLVGPMIAHAHVLPI